MAACRITCGQYPSNSNPFESFESTSCAPILILPWLGCSSAIIIFIVDVLPAPLGPKRPKTWPFLTEKETFFTATLAFWGRASFCLFLHLCQIKLCKLISNHMEICCIKNKICVTKRGWSNKKTYVRLLPFWRASIVVDFLQVLDSHCSIRAEVIEIIIDTFLFVHHVIVRIKICLCCSLWLQ